MNFAKGLSLNFASTVLTLVLGFANMVVVTRALGPEGRWQYALLSYTIMLLILMFGEGLITTNTYLVSKVTDRVPQAVTNSLLYGIAFSALIGALYFPIWKVLPFFSQGMERALIFAALAIAALKVLSDSLSAVLLGLERMLKYCAMPVLIVSLYLAGNIAALHLFKWGLLGVLGSWILALAIALGVLLFFFLKAGELGRAPDWSLLRQTARVGWRATITKVFIFLLFYADSSLVARLSTEAQAGIYTIVLVYADMVQRIPNLATVVLFPKVSSDKVQNKDELTAQVSRGILLICLALCAGFVALGPQITALFGEEFESAYPCFLRLIPGVIAAALGSVINVNLWGRGFPWVVVAAPCLAFAVDIGLGWTMIPAFGIAGAAMAKSMAYLVWTGMLCLYFLRVTSISPREVLLPRFSDLSTWSRSLRTQLVPTQGRSNIK